MRIYWFLFNKEQKSDFEFLDKESDKSMIEVNGGGDPQWSSISPFQVDDFEFITCNIYHKNTTIFRQTNVFFLFCIRFVLLGELD